MEYCETSTDQPFRNETVSDCDHSSCRFSVCKSLTCSDHQGGFSSLRAKRLKFRKNCVLYLCGKLKLKSAVINWKTILE